MNDDILDILVAHGVPGAVIVQVAKLIADAKITEQLRDSARERMRRVRERSRKHPNTPEQVVTPSSFKKEDIKEEKKEGVTQRKAGTKLPSDWKPRQQEIDEGLKLGWSLIGIEAKADDMRIWATANANRAIARKADWHATFRGMLRRDKPKPSTPTVQTAVLNFAAGFDARTKMQLAEREEIERQRRRP